MRKIGIQIIFIVVAFVATMFSSYYEQSFPDIVGNECPKTKHNESGFCYELLPKGGFPVSYLYDNSGTSVVGSLSFIEDTFYPQWFLVDLIFFYALLNLGAVSLFSLKQKWLFSKN